MLCLVGLAPAAYGDSPPIVTTTLGQVRGKTEHDVNVFRGIPFAAPPTSGNRFRPPQPGVPWQGIRDAYRTGHQCPQLAILGSEDCLYLHVAVPKQCTPQNPCPVLHWFYGGAFVIGSDEEFGFYEPIELARSQGIVVVAGNYRLSSLGFLATPELLRESGTAGNWATLDQRKALEWTQANIGAFGGDHAAVTIAGESAGAMSVCWHLAAPASRGLFHRAIMESGTCFQKAFFMPLADALAFGSARAAKAGCDAKVLGDDAKFLSCLRALPPRALHAPAGAAPNASWSPLSAAHALRAAGSAADEGVAGLPLPAAAASEVPSPPFDPAMDWGPVIDGAKETLSMQPLEMLQRGSTGGSSLVPTLVGTNHDEGSLFVTMYPQIAPGTHIIPRAGDLVKMLVHVFGKGWGNVSAARASQIAEAVDQRYDPKRFPSEFWRNAAVLRDYVFACPTRRLARALDQHGAPVYHYLFAPKYCTDPSLLSDPTWVDMHLLHCYHMTDLYAVWGHAFPRVPLLRTLTRPMREVSQAVQGYWGAFVRNGTPNAAGPFVRDGEGHARANSTQWPRFRAKTQGSKELTLQIAEEPSAVEDYMSDTCDWWDQLCSGTDCFGV